jgi:hypothetical protein
MFNIVSKDSLVKFYIEKMFTELQAAAELYGVDDNVMLQQFYDYFEDQAVGGGVWDACDLWSNG